MATVTRATDPLPDPGDEIKAEPIRDQINNLLSFLEGNNIDENNIDTSSTDGVVGLSVSQPVTGLKSFEISSTSTGIQEVMRIGRNPSSGTLSDDDGARLSFRLDDDGGTATTVGYFDIIAADVSAGTVDIDLKFEAMIGGTVRELMAMGSSGTVFNQDSQDVDFTIESNDIANMFDIDAGLNTIGIGTNAVDDRLVSISPPATAHTATTNTYTVHIGADGAQTIPSGTTAYVASLNVEEPNITATGTVTNAATVRIANAPTEGSSNYALWVDDGAVQIDSNLTVGGNITVTGGMTVAGANAFDVGDSD